MTAVALAIAVLFVVPDWFASIALLIAAFALPAMLTTTIACGSGYLRAFCVGALFPCAGVLIAVASPMFIREFHYINVTWPLFHDGRTERYFEHLEKFAEALRALSAASWALALIVGFACVGTRWMVVRGNRLSETHAEDGQ